MAESADAMLVFLSSLSRVRRFAVRRLVGQGRE